LLDDSIENFNDLSSFIDYVGKKIRYPIILGDVNHRIVAYSNHEKVSDIVRIETIIKKHVSEDIINRLWEEGVFTKLMEEDKPVVVDYLQDVNIRNRVILSIKNKKDILGYLWVLFDENNPPNEEKMEFLVNVAEELRIPMIQYYSYRGYQHLGSQDFIWQLLLGNIKSEVFIKKNFKILGKQCPEHFSVAIFRFDKPVEIGVRKQISYMLESQSLEAVFNIFNKQDLIVLVSVEAKECYYQSLDQYIDSFIDLLKERFEFDNVIGVYGGIYEDISKVERSYSEALEVLDIKDKFKTETENIKSYDALGIYKFIYSLAEKRKEDYKNPILMKLEQYDKCHNQGFLETLEAYLDCDCNTYTAANALHIHSNTLNYRLKRIKEIANIDLEDFNQKVGLYIDLKIKKLLDK